MTRIDLHTHSIESDGTNTIAANVELARERGLQGLAITDHDTTSGYGAAEASTEGTDLAWIPGIEFSAEHDGASLHILGYWVDPEDPEVNRELDRLTATRMRRGELIVERLRELGFDVSFDRVREIAGGETIARPHVAQAMVEAGIVASEREAFERYISDDGPAYVPKHALAPTDVLRLIRAAGGGCVLAHPGMWKGNGSVPDELIEEMAEGGMIGLEVWHPDHDDAMRGHYASIASRLGLVATSASDCHGERFGYRLGSERTDEETYAELRRRAGR